MCYIKNKKVFFIILLEFKKKIKIVKDFKIINYIYGIKFIIDIVYFLVILM